jgi:four helix bundle protein
MAFKFEQLRVWQDAVQLSGDLHLLIKKFPKEEMYVLSSQLLRASDSISLNIAEGSTGQTNPEFKRFLSYALRSAIEVACLYLAKKRNLIDEQEFQQCYTQTETLIISIQSLKNAIK